MQLTDSMYKDIKDVIDIAVHKASTRFPSIPRDELLSEANWLAVTAASRFDPNGGATFRTYLARCLDNIAQRVHSVSKPREVTCFDDAIDIGDDSGVRKSVSASEWACYSYDCSGKDVHGEAFYKYYRVLSPDARVLYDAIMSGRLDKTVSWGNGNSASRWVPRSHVSADTISRMLDNSVEVFFSDGSSIVMDAVKWSVDRCREALEELRAVVRQYVNGMKPKCVSVKGLLQNCSFASV